VAVGSDTPHLPRPALIEAYGNGGFRFAGMSHRGSLLCLPDGIWPWPVETPDMIDEAALALVFARAPRLDLFLLGSGQDLWIMPEPLRRRFRELPLKLEIMPTAPAFRTYNVLFAEDRRVGAGLIAVP
jgi:uncharacterized protein